MEPPRIPLLKAFDAPFISLDETSIELSAILFLFLAVLLASQAQSHRQALRRLVQGVSLLFFFFIIYSCLGVFGMIRNGLYGITMISAAETEAFYWLALPVVILAVTLLCGPLFCGWVCPTGTIQEWTLMLRRAVWPDRKLVGRVQFAILALALLAFLAVMIWISLGKRLFVEDSSLHWAAALLLLCYLVVIDVADDRALRRIRLLSVLAIVLTAITRLTITSPVHFAFTSRDDPASALATVVLMVASMVVARAWCRYLCPWGLIVGFMSRFAQQRLEVVRPQCTECRQCHAVCDVAAIEGSPTRIRHDDCQLCFACVDVCKSRAIRLVDTWQTDATARPCPPPPSAANIAPPHADETPKP
jgi:polyferredoxin